MCETHRHIVWGYQKHFVDSVQRCAEKLFDTILRVRPIVAGVVAWGEDENGVTIGVVIDLDESVLPDVSAFANLDATTKECEGNDPRRNVFQTHPIAQEGEDRALRMRSRQCAIEQLLNGNSKLPEIRWMASDPAKLEEWQLSVVLGLPFNALVGTQSLPEYVTERGYRADTSYVESLVRTYLNACRVALLTDGDRTDGLWPEKHDEWRRDAADRFVRQGIIPRTGHGFALTDMLSALNRLSAEAYESEHAVGGIVLAHPKHKALKHAVRFVTTVELSHTRAARKLLQMSGGSVFLHANAEKVEGLCTLDSASVGERHEDFKSAFKIAFTGHFRWQIQHADNVLLRMAYGSPIFPRPKVEIAGFKETFSRIFRDAAPEQGETIWAYVQSCVEQRHGTMLAVVEGAKEESERLDGQCISIEPRPLDKEVLLTASAIDGAILTDPTGTCFAFGTILDGVAVEEGNSARGARFNSAIRYIASRRSAGQGCVCVVVSEDGSVDVLPKLKPRMSRSNFEASIKRFEEACSRRPVDRSEVQPMRYRFDNLQDYLTQDYAARINTAWDQVPPEPDEIGTIHVQFEPMQGRTVPDDLWAE